MAYIPIPTFLLCQSFYGPLLAENNFVRFCRELIVSFGISRKNPVGNRNRKDFSGGRKPRTYCAIYNPCRDITVPIAL